MELTREEQELLEICVRIQQEKEQQYEEVGVPLYAPLPELYEKEVYRDQIVIQM